ncbi:ALP1-like protein [Tanacetum coccineum]
MFHSWLTTCLIKEDIILLMGYIRNGLFLLNQLKILYKTKHEAAKKDVKRAFGVLKQKWKLIKYPARGLTQSRLSDIMYTCIILHNMIIHDNGNAISPDIFPKEQHLDDDPVRTHAESMQVTQEIIDRMGHLSLKADLVEHIWNNAN